MMRKFEKLFCENYQLQLKNKNRFIFSTPKTLIGPSVAFTNVSSNENRIFFLSQSKKLKVNSSQKK